MQHENHCMLVAEHDWSFVGVQGEKGVLQDPGTNYCLDALNSPWNGMLGLQVGRIPCVCVCVCECMCESIRLCVCVLLGDFSRFVVLVPAFSSSILMC